MWPSNPTGTSMLQESLRPAFCRQRLASFRPHPARSEVKIIQLRTSNRLKMEPITVRFEPISSKL